MNKKGSVIWITGLSGAGKSTLANLLAQKLRSQNLNITLLDGDDLRAIIGKKSSGFDRKTRLSNGLQYGTLCKLLANQGHIVIIAVIALIEEIHIWNRKNLPGYFEIYLNVPINVLRDRDTKELYKGFDAGDIKNVCGLDIPFDPPANPEMEIEYCSDQTPFDILEIVTKKINTSKIMKG